MENKEIVKQMLALQKTSFDNCFLAMSVFQEQAEKFLKAYIDHVPGMSDEGKKVIDQWTILYKKGFDDLKKALDEAYDKAESFSEYNNAMFMFQDMTRKIFDLFSYQNDGISFDFMKNMEEMVAMYKKGYEEFNKQLGDNIERGGNFFPASAKPQTDRRK
ncbi:MAG: hypothetical protein ACLPSL_12060 [Smithella sp.]